MINLKEALTEWLSDLRAGKNAGATHWPQEVLISKVEEILALVPRPAHYIFPTDFGPVEINYPMGLGNQAASDCIREIADRVLNGPKINVSTLGSGLAPRECWILINVKTNKMEASFSDKPMTQWEPNLYELRHMREVHPQAEPALWLRDRIAKEIMRIIQSWDGRTFPAWKDLGESGEKVFLRADADCILALLPHGNQGNSKARPMKLRVLITPDPHAQMDTIRIDSHPIGGFIQQGPRELLKEIADRLMSFEGNPQGAVIE